MTGILAAFGGITSGSNVLYTAGLYNTSLGVDQSPITASGTSISGAVSYNYTWIGYYRPGVTGAVSIGLQCPYTEYVEVIPNFSSSYTQQINWGGGGNSVGYVWIGSTAISGFSAGNATVSAANGNGASSPSLIAGSYYPIRINWSTTLPYTYDSNFGDDYRYYATSSFTFTVGGTSTVTNLIFYNGRTNGF